jgi:hypothetical protein
VFNGPKAIKGSSPTYKENLIHAHQIWIEYNQLASDIDEKCKKNKKYKVMLYIFV